MSNGSLKDWIHRRKRHQDGTGLSAEEVLNIVIDACWGLVPHRVEMVGEHNI